MKNSILLCIALMFVATISKAQTIPNAGFENWATVGSYANPDSWATLNAVTAVMGTYTCMKGTPGNPGSSYIKLVSKMVAGMGVMPGIAVSGKFDQSTMQPSGGFAFNQRPANLTGSWQHMIYGNSQGFVDVQLTRWDAGMQKRVPVAFAHNTLSGMAMSWSMFNISLAYVDGYNPDTCIITLSASGPTPTANDYLYADNLAFTGNVTGITSVSISPKIKLFPNPATESLMLDLSALKDKMVTLSIFDMQGKQVNATQQVMVSSTANIDISNLPKGNYLLSVTGEAGIMSCKFIKE